MIGLPLDKVSKLVLPPDQNGVSKTILDSNKKSNPSVETDKVE